MQAPPALHPNRIFVTACFVIGFFGVAMFSLGALMPQLTQSLPEAISLPQYMSVGIFLGTVLAGPVADRLGYKQGLIPALLCVFVGIFTLIYLPRITALRIGFFFLGFGGGACNCLTSSLASDLAATPAERGRKTSLISASYGIGALLWTLWCALATDYILPLKVILVMVGLALVAVIVQRFPQAKPSESNGLRDFFSLLRSPVLLLFCAALILQSGLEGMSGNYSTQFLTLGGLPLSTAGFALTLYTVGMLLGRVVLALTAGRLKPVVLLYIYLALGFAGSGLLHYAGSWASPGLSYLSLALIGLGLGATFPIAVSYLGAVFRDQTGTAVGIAMGVSLWGNIVVNAGTAQMFMADRGDFLPQALMGAMALLAVLLPMAVRVASRKTIGQ